MIACESSGQRNGSEKWSQALAEDLLLFVFAGIGRLGFVFVHDSGGLAFPFLLPLLIPLAILWGSLP
jgi:hypothetical protein